MKLRKEFDSIGKISVPNDKYWGASTQRSKRYFDIGEFLVRPILIKSIAIIKKAAAIVHGREKQILPNISKAIIKASNEVIAGKLNENLIPGILKTCTLGYDGKGQFKINSIKEIDENIDFNNEYILEKKINLKKEISIIISRFGHQKYELYEPIENVHEDQILKHSKIPADISETLKEKSIDWAKKIVEDLDYIGTLCVEYFIDKNDNLYVNEIAPRVHNSGHLTMNTHNISQFENHVRAVCGLEKIETKKISNGKMINLIGSDISEYRGKTFADNEFFYDYLKTEIRDKRKMGHLTIIENKS